MKAGQQTPARGALKSLGRRLRSALARPKRDPADRCSRKGCRGCLRHGRCDGDESIRRELNEA